MTAKVPRRKKTADKKRLAVLRGDEEHYTIEFTPIDPFKDVYYVRVVGADLEVLAKSEWRLGYAVLTKATLKKTRE